MKRLAREDWNPSPESERIELAIRRHEAEEAARLRQETKQKNEKAQERARLARGLPAKPVPKQPQKKDQHLFQRFQKLLKREELNWPIPDDLPQPSKSQRKKNPTLSDKEAKELEQLKRKFGYYDDQSPPESSGSDYDEAEMLKQFKKDILIQALNN